MYVGTAVVVYVPSIISSTHSKIYGRVAGTFLLPCGQGLEFYISLRESSINQ